MTSLRSIVGYAKKQVAPLRKQLWHLRQGGIRQLIRHRSQAIAGRKASWRKLSAGDADGVQGYWSRSGSHANRQLNFLPAEIPEVTPRYPDLTVAVIADPFTELALKFEWNQIAVRPNNWLTEVDWDKIDLVFVESAWAGNDGAWSHQLTGKNAPSAEIKSMISYVKQQGIPTVFWNKEDPPHYQDFVETARIFDYVFTSDAGRVDNYRQDLGHDRVGVLSFAAQPVLHNPIRPVGFHERDVAFAGMYFDHKYPKRKQQLELLLNGAEGIVKERQPGLEIFARHQGASKNHQFPEKYQGNVVGELTYPEMLSAYKAYKVMLNVNSAPESTTMCSRRVFEAVASGSTVVSAKSESIRTYFPEDQIQQPWDRFTAMEAIGLGLADTVLTQSKNHLAQREIWKHHTYSHRVDTILGAVGIPHDTSKKFGEHSISVVLPTIRPDQIEHALGSYGRQIVEEKELILLTHGFEVDPGQLADLKSRLDLKNVRVEMVDSSLSLGEVLNHGIDMAEGDMITKMDDDDMYGAHYLSDLLFAYDFSGASIVGKLAHYMYLSHRDITILRLGHSEHKFANMVMGPTLTGSADLFREYKFGQLGRGEDSDLLKRVRTDGGRIYSSDRYNYTQLRNRHGHTWRTNDAGLVPQASEVLLGNYYNNITL
ncbi:glycosyltransferase family protein [Haematomicrobium sanguinis]|uniref:glycosyltransferase family protein n=1 Tax=Haematomicrobium sanguinis TaxID=479106 RepID=UPI000559068F|nr:glycosyltransferase [Haematomicrobium sanguinis]